MLTVGELAFLLVGGWRWLNTGKHFGPMHRWLIMSVGLVVLGVMLGIV